MMNRNINTLDTTLLGNFEIESHQEVRIISKRKNIENILNRNRFNLRISAYNRNQKSLLNS